MRFPNKIKVDGTGVLTYYKRWMKETIGKRGEEWDCYWDESVWYELTFKNREDLTAFVLRFCL